MVQCGIDAGTTDTSDSNRYGTTAGNVFYDDIAITFAAVFTVVNCVIVSNIFNNIGSQYGGLTTSGMTLRVYDESNAASVSGSWTVHGTWY